MSAGPLAAAFAAAAAFSASAFAAAAAFSVSAFTAAFTALCPLSAPSFTASFTAAAFSASALKAAFFASAAASIAASLRYGATEAGACRMRRMHTAHAAVTSAANARQTPSAMNTPTLESELPLGVEGGDGGEATATVGTDSTVMPSAVEAEAAVARLEASEVSTAAAVVVAGTAMTAVMITLAASTLMVTAEASTSAAVAMFWIKFGVSE